MPRRALVSLIAALLALPAAAQVHGTDALILDNVLGTTPVFSRADPFALAAIASHTANGTIGADGHLTAADRAAFLTNKTDLAALRAYHYGSPDIVESPAEWFAFDGAGTITGINSASVTNWNIVIPWQIGVVPVTTIGAEAFLMSGIVSVVAPQTVTTVGNIAFADCSSLTSVTIPQATSIGDGAFAACSSLTSVTIPQATAIGSSAFVNCNSLASVSLPQVTSIGAYAFASCSALTAVHMGQNAPAEAADVFVYITPPPNVYATDPQATGWGATWNGAPVVRPPLYADAIHQAGELVATTGDVARAIAAIPVPDLSDRPTFAQIAASNALPYTVWTGTVTPANGTATVTIAHGNMPVLVVDAPCVLTLDPTGYGTAGVSRVSLSYYLGTNSFAFSTNVITYSATPTVDTNGWNTLLIRRVSDGAWKGVGL